MDKKRSLSTGGELTFYSREEKIRQNCNSRNRTRSMEWWLLEVCKVRVCEGKAGKFL